MLCLLIIPCSFAEDNGTDITDNDNFTDYYFDVDAVSDGDGQKDTPYNNFTDERVNDNSTIHLASGEYVFEKSREFSNISFYGENPQTTILNGNGSILTSNGVLNFRNLTITNFHIINNANLNAKDAIFTQLISTIENQDNDFGGAIYAPSNRNLYLDNCTFFDNIAEYAGAIYVKGGNLTIINSLFYNITSYNFGGTIVGQSGVGVVISNTRFLNVKSVKDAGGAIYLVSSSLVASNLTVVNASATFGSAITALRSTLNLTDSRFENNSAKFEGGAIYQFYGSLYINSSSFINNSARNGGAVFIDDVNVLNITNNDFIKNNASNYAGAVYYLLNDDVNLTSNIFTNNSARLFNDIYNTSSINLDIGNGNYTLYILNQTTNSTLPDKYDLRDYGFVTPVKDQKDGGNCWAFASIAALESCILKASGEVLDLSEENMKNIMAFYSDYGRNIRAPNDGGDNDMPIAYLVSWLGPVNESDDEYDDLSSLSPVLDSLMHVQNVVYFKRNNYTDNDVIKQAILNYGAVATTMRYDASSIFFYTADKIAFHYYKGNESTNHAVAIVGWDDNLTLEGKTGAWLVKNSWGPNWANDGYFYVSYYDTAFARPGNCASYTFILNDTIHFDRNYQYDISGPTDYFYNTLNQVWYENAYYASDNEFLAAVSTYFEKNTLWEINVYVNGILQLVQNGTAVPGYFTINLDYPIPLVKGDLFEIMFKIVVDGHAGFPITEAMSIAKMSYPPNSSFVSYDFGTTFYSLYDLIYYYPSPIYYNHHYNSQVACIKGFSQMITLNSTIKDLNVTYDSLNIFNITVSLVDENNNVVRNGNVTFTVNGADYNVSVHNGIAVLQIPFALGLKNISAVFNSPNYYSSKSNTTFNVLPIPVEMNITVIQDFNNALINFTFSKLINNETLVVQINDDVHTLRTINGSAFLNLTDLEYGNYIINVLIDSDFYVGQNSTDFFVNVKRTSLEVDNLTTVYNSGGYFIVKLNDQFNQPVCNRNVEFYLNNNVYSNITDEEGIAVLSVNLKDSTYPIIVSFKGDESYIKSQNSSTVTVKSSIALPLNQIYTLNSNYEVYLLDKSGNPLINCQVTFTINNINYYAASDLNGKATLAVPIMSGNVLVNVLNPKTGEVKSQNIQIKPRITENNNLVMYYGAGKYFRVKVFSDNGGVAGSGEIVTFRLNGISYNLKTDKNGYATIKINSKPGKYTITATYKGFTVSNKITVKPTLITKNKSIKKGKILKFTAKLLNKNGKILKNKKITFKIKGKTYKAKTNKKGIATIKIRNLKVGKYTITTKYAKLKNKNRITVKK